jgi:hypothetical protein
MKPIVIQRSDRVLLDDIVVYFELSTLINPMVSSRLPLRKVHKHQYGQYGLNYIVRNAVSRELLFDKIQVVSEFLLAVSLQNLDVLYGFSFFLLFGQVLWWV